MQTWETQTSDIGIIILFVFGRYWISLCRAETRKISSISHSILRFSKKRLVFWSFHVNWTFLPVMQCISSFNKNSLLWLSTLAFIPVCNWIQLPYLVRRHTLEFPPAVRLIRMCWIASKTSTWNKLFKRQKKKDDQTNLNQEGVFQRWNVSFFCLLRLFKCNVLFGLVCKGRD